jgi:hypothetical protein
MACQFPFMIENPLPVGFSTIPVPCGKCYDCRMRIVTQWAFRLQQEENICTSSHFVTLTYNTESVPISKKGFMTLDKESHLKNFFKKLRNKYRYRAKNPLTGKMKYYYDKVPKIKYFAVGEYGFQRERPHYHIILFNADANYIVDSWNYGDVHIGNVQEGSIIYCLKYVMKEGKIPKHKNDDRIPEFRRSSTKLGIHYLTPGAIKYHRQNITKPITTLNGFKVPIPRYFRKKIWTEDELRKINPIIAKSIKQRIENEEFKHSLDENYDDSYTDQQRKRSDYRRKRAENRSKSQR